MDMGRTPNKNSSDTLKRSRLHCRMILEKSEPLTESGKRLPSQNIVNVLFL